MPGIKGRHLTEKGLFVKMNDLIIKKKKKKLNIIIWVHRSQVNGTMQCRCFRKRLGIQIQHKAWRRAHTFNQLNWSQDTVTLRWISKCFLRIAIFKAYTCIASIWNQQSTICKCPQKDYVFIQQNHFHLHLPRAVLSLQPRLPSAY